MKKIVENKFLIEGAVSIEAQSSILPNTPVWVLSHPHPKYGGSMHNKIIDQLYRRALDHQISVIRYNFRGVGQSQGSYDDGPGEMDDLRLVIQYLAQEHQIQTKDIHLIGYSFGSYISACVAADIDDLQRLTLIAPPTEMIEFPQLQKNYPIHLYMPEADEYTDPNHAKQYLETVEAPKEYIEVQGADHFFVGTTKKFVDLFLKSNT